ncbi:hypothetical protein KI688_001779 [Linnemannia hyalina]|uniref:F-box domain-containing protein n=1 Tax=Linnemannia hyalina TaxID=64524 RepID=A0A9P7XTL5_9FUNG|nr:hypothetical protein KI688_001779 [Linnemannia hyalina]
MTTILDLPDEIRLLIGKELPKKSIYTLIRVCRSFYSSFIPCIWSDLSLTNLNKSTVITADQVRLNAHRIETISFPTTLSKDYYAITYPCLHTLWMLAFYLDGSDDDHLQVQLQEKIDFLRRHPFLRKLNYQQKDTLSMEFWEVVATELAQLEDLMFMGVVEQDAVDAFWRTCERVQNLHLMDVTFHPASMPILSTRSFRRLRDLTINKYSWEESLPRRMWPVHLLERAKESENLKRLEWSVRDIDFPVQLVLDAFEKNCWRELCELSIGGVACSDQDVAMVLRSLTSRRLTDFELSSGRFGPLIYSCLKEMYFGHLRDLRLGQAPGVTSGMVQEIMTECVHLVNLEAPYIFVRSIATASKSWGCLKLEKLVVYIASQAGDEADWDGRAFEQIARLKRVRTLGLQGDPDGLSFVDDEDSRSQDIMYMQTLDLRLPSSRTMLESCNNGGSGDIRGWSSLLQLREFSFDGDRQWMGVDELEWMTEHWKDLTCISGNFRAAVGIASSDRLKQLLNQHGIRHYEDV